jgi:hypothetical protein
MDENETKLTSKEPHGTRPANTDQSPADRSRHPGVSKVRPSPVPPLISLSDFTQVAILRD